MVNLEMKLYETLFILYKCNKSITTTWEVYNESDTLFRRLPQWQTSMGDYIFLECINFLDEYNAMGSNVETQFLDRVKMVKTISKPIKNRISRWKGLEKFRNNFIGHGYRDRGKFVIPDPAIYRVPRNPFEIVQLALLIKYIWEIVESEFKTEVDQMLRHISKLIPNQLRQADYSNINEDLNNMGSEIDALCKRYNKPFPIKIMGFHLSANDE
jgi:hypothetical protein